MDLIEQYLRAVAALLPRGQREDITAELRDIILSRIEAREAALGRQLSDEEIEEELRAIGHPILVAARYRDEPQHLVGPALYPYWMFGVKIAIAIQAAGALVVLIIRTLSGHDFAFALGRAISQGIFGSVTLIGVATVAAWLIERRMINVTYLDRWKVRDLRVLEYAGWDFTDLRDHFRDAQAPRAARTAAFHSARADSRQARAERRMEWRRSHRVSPVGRGIFLVAFGTVFVLWWIKVLHLALFNGTADLRELGFDLDSLAGMNLGQLRDTVFWPVLFYGLAIIVQGGLILVYPRAVWLRGLVTLLMGVALLGICLWLWTASPIAAAIRVDSVATLVLKLKTAFQHSPPLALAPLLTLWLACTAFGAVIKIVQGLWEMLILPWQVQPA
jgi:hypothetical protein